LADLFAQAARSLAPEPIRGRQAEGWPSGETKNPTNWPVILSEAKNPAGDSLFSKTAKVLMDSSLRSE
jgi:hypothetical protein